MDDVKTDLMDTLTAGREPGVEETGEMPGSIEPRAGRPMMEAIEAMVGVWALTDPDMPDVVELIDRVTRALWSPRERARRVDAAVLRNVG